MQDSNFTPIAVKENYSFAEQEQKGFEGWA